MRPTFDALEFAFEHPLDSADERAELAVAWINETLAGAFRRKPPGFKLNGADPCEKVAEALAVWLVESDPEGFADILARPRD